MLHIVGCSGFVDIVIALFGSKRPCARVFCRRVCGLSGGGGQSVDCPAGGSMTRGNTAAAASARSARGYGGGGGGGGGPGQVFGSAEPANQYASQYVRAIAMPRTCVLLLLLLSCAGCARAAAATAATVVSPPSFRSANLTAAGLLAATKYGKTVLAGDEITVAAQEYADCVVFRVQARTRGYVALGFVDPIASSVDVLLAWVDDDTGAGHVMVSFLPKQAGRLRHIHLISVTL